MRQAGEAPASGKDQAYRPSAMRHPRGGCDAPDAYRSSFVSRGNQRSLRFGAKSCFSFRLGPFDAKSQRTGQSQRLPEVAE